MPLIVSSSSTRPLIYALYCEIGGLHIIQTVFSNDFGVKFQILCPLVSYLKIDENLVPNLKFTKIKLFPIGVSKMSSRGHQRSKILEHSDEGFEFLVPLETSQSTYKDNALDDNVLKKLVSRSPEVK